MPKTPKADKAPSLADTIAAWIEKNPGRYRPNEVADALPNPQPDRGEAWWRQKVTNEMSRMGRQGRLEKVRANDRDMGPGALYWLPGTVLKAKA